MNDAAGETLLRKVLVAFEENRNEDAVLLILEMHEWEVDDNRILEVINLALSTFTKMRWTEEDLKISLGLLVMQNRLELSFEL